MNKYIFMYEIQYDSVSMIEINVQWERNNRLFKNGKTISSRCGDRTPGTPSNSSTDNNFITSKFLKDLP